MKKTKPRRTRFVGLRFTEEEFSKIGKLKEHATTPAISEFIRRCVLHKPVTMRHRNQSLDEIMLELTAIRKELKAIGNNFNQSAKALHTFKSASSIADFTAIYNADREKMFALVELVYARINQIADAWLQ
jgi:hypothetical protein